MSDSCPDGPHSHPFDYEGPCSEMNTIAASGQLRDALGGLFAYDTGCVSSGIHDERLRGRVIAYLRGLSEEDFRLIMSRCVREMFLDEAALAQGYGIEDMARFIEWLSDRMETDL